MRRLGPTSIVSARLATNGSARENQSAKPSARPARVATSATSAVPATSASTASDQRSSTLRWVGLIPFVSAAGSAVLSASFRPVPCPARSLAVEAALEPVRTLVEARQRGLERDPALGDLADDLVLDVVPRLGPRAVEVAVVGGVED